MTTRPWTKLRATRRSPPRPPLRSIIVATTGAMLALAAIGWLGDAAGQPLLMAPLGASCVLAFALPESPLAQPRNIIGGHVVAAAVGLGVAATIGHDAFAFATAGSLATAAMLISGTLHAPAGATPLVVVAQHADARFLLTPVLAGSAVLVAVALLFNNLQHGRRYPEYWR